MLAGSILGKSSHPPAYGQTRFHQLVKPTDSNANCAVALYALNCIIALSTFITLGCFCRVSPTLHISVIFHILNCCILLHSIICPLFVVAFTACPRHCICQLLTLLVAQNTYQAATLLQCIVKYITVYVYYSAWGNILKCIGEYIIVHCK